ncbi:MAG: FtsX-like permease family protein [Chloroflexi bacterium]|nr:FtsX-like permease family protein [Chloroflexota bacterium]
MRLTLFEPFRYARLVLRRSSSDVALLAGVGAAALIATTVIGGAPTYLDSLDKVAVRSTIDNASLIGRNVVIVNDGDVQVRIPVLDEYTANVEAALEDQFGDISGPMRQVMLPPHHARVVPPSAPPLTVQDFTVMRFEYIEGVEDHITYVAGSAPVSIPDPAPGEPVIEVGLWVDHLLLKLDRIAVGETFTARTIRGPGETIRLRLSGLFQVHDVDDEFWMNRGRDLIEPPALSGFFGPVPGFFISREALERIADAGPYGRFTASWVLPVDASEIRDLEASEITSRVDGLYGKMLSNAPGSTVLTGLEVSFDSLARRLAFSRIPMALIATLLLAFVGYYLYMTARSLAERRQQEMGVMQSRGASLVQVGRMYGLEALIIVGVPVIVGPLLALLLISQAGRLPLYSDATGGGALPVSLDWTNYALSFAAGLVALVVVVGPALAFGHGSVVAGKRGTGRPDETPFLHRYFLDFALLAGAGYLAWELNLRGGVPVRVSEIGEIETDNAILFLPALLLVAISLVFLRLFPLGMRLIARIAVPVVPVWAAIALWRLSRTPYSYAAIVVFLMLAAGVVAVAGTLSSTLRQSAEDRSAYSVGADVRVRMPAGDQVAAASALAFADPVRAIEGVLDASAALRASGRIAAVVDGAEINVLGVQPAAFGRVATFRDDFSDQSLTDLMELIQVDGRAEPILLPEDANEIGIWLQTDDDIPNMFFWVRLRTADGIPLTRSLGPVEPGPWRFQAASLEGLKSPIEVLGLQVFQESSGNSATPTVLMIDDLTAIASPEGSGRLETVVASFDDQGTWRALPTNRGADSSVSLFRGEARGVVARFDLGPGTNGGIRGIYRPDLDGPMPVIVSDALVNTTPVQPGIPFIASIGGSFIEVIPVGTAGLFPTMDPDSASGFIVLDVEAFARYSEITGGSLARNIDEMFIGLADPDKAGRSDQTLSTIRNAFPGLVSVDDRRTVEEESLVDPLAVAGWRGVALLGGVIALLVVVAGYLTYLSAYAARMRLQEALLRSVGVSTGEFAKILIVEHIVVGIVGVTLGTISGLVMSRIAVSASVRTTGGEEVLPPFDVLTEWLPVSVFFLALAVTAVVSLAAMVISFRRERLYEATRLEA